MKITLNDLIRFGAIILIFALLFNCKKDNVSTKVPTNVVIKDTSIVNRFIYTGLQTYYLWEDSIPNLKATKYNNADTLNAYLNSYNDPQKFFTSLLYQSGTVDKWSFLVNDSTTISNWIAGISQTLGIDIGWYNLKGTSNVFGLVHYVYGSPAAEAGIKRGDVFMKINDQQLTVSNYYSLFYENSGSYKLSFGTLTGNNTTGHTLTLNGRTVTMTAVTLQENPILMDTVLTVGNYKVGYLVYNGFNSDFDLQLNQVFQDFKSAAIDKLIVDLRYNGGGSVQTATYLASMIYGTATSKVFYTEQYNPFVQAYYQSTDPTSLSNNFVSQIAATSTTAATPINALNLSSLYVIMTDGTASASELLINGLTPYMNVFKVGSNTVGKYVASVTIQDWETNGTVNPKDPYVMQPIIVRIANSQGVTNFRNGLTPDYSIQEDVANLMPFGDPNETLLKPVLDQIQGIPLSSVSLKSTQLGLKKLGDSQSYRIFPQSMYIKNFKKIPKK